MTALNRRFDIFRLLKQGLFIKNDSVVQALHMNADIISTKGVHWTFSNIQTTKITVVETEYDYVSGEMIQYREVANIELLDKKEKLIKNINIADSIISKRTFFYFPIFSAIIIEHGSQKEWTGIKSVITKLINKGLMLSNIPGECFLEAISNLKKITNKILSLQNIKTIRASIEPSNPIYSPLWESLDAHLRARNSESLQVRENAKDDMGLKTQIPTILKNVQQDPPKSQDINPVDAAVLMALDGYGHASIKGKDNSTKKETIIRTSDNQQHFEISPNQPNQEIAKRIVKELNKLQEERKWRKL